MVAEVVRRDWSILCIAPASTGENSFALLKKMLLVYRRQARRAEMGKDGCLPPLPMLPRGARSTECFKVHFC